MEANGKSFVEHWKWAAKKGLMNGNTAATLQAAARQVLNVEDKWEEIDISKLDVEVLLTRFQNIKGKKFTPNSLDTYKRRFRQARDLYLQYVADPSSWKPPKGSDRQTSRKTPNNGDSTPEPAASTSPKMIIPTSTDAGMVDYPYPLREGKVARLRLPFDLKMIEVRRLTAFMSTLAVDFEAPEA